MARKDPVAHMGHPDPKHPTNIYKDDAAKLVDYEGRPVVSGMPWSEAGTDLWLFVVVTDQVIPTPDHPVGTPEPRMAYWAVGGVVLSVGVSHGKPKWSANGVYGASIELPVDLGRDEMKRTYITDWLKDTAHACLVHAVCEMEFRGIPGEDPGGDMGRFLTGAAEKAIGGMGL